MEKIGFKLLLAIFKIFLLNINSVSAADVTIERTVNVSSSMNYYI